jgi:hypothetical protein
MRIYLETYLLNIQKDQSLNEIEFDPFEGAKPRLLRRGRIAPLRVNPEQPPAFRLGRSKG